MDSNSTHSNATATGSQNTGPPAALAAITPTNHTGIVLIGTALALVFSVVSMLIRLYIRFQIRHEFSLDDTASIAAVAVSVVQSGFVFAQAASGFGKTLADVSPSGLVELQKDGYAADILYIVAIWLTKCSAAFLFIRLSPYKRHVVSSQICLALSTLFMIISILLIALRCNLSEPWIFIDSGCTGLFWRWQAVTAFDITTEVCLFGVAIYMGIGLQLPFKKKFVVILAFSLRLFTVIPAAMRLELLGRELSGNNPTFDGVLVCVCTQIQISYAIIATTTPCLRPFMSALNTHYGGPTETRTPSGSKVSRTARSDNSYSMGTFASRGKTERVEGLVVPVGLPRSQSPVIGIAVTTVPSTSSNGWGREDQMETGSVDRISEHRSMQSNESQRRIVISEATEQKECSIQETPDE